MKWAVFIALLAVAWPAGRCLRGRTQAIAAMVMAMGCLPFLGLEHIDINLLSFKTYRGDSRGLELTLVDLLAIAVLGALPGGRRVPHAWIWLLYLLAVTNSIADAPLPLFSWFSVWKIVRMFVFFSAVVRAAAMPRLASSLLSGMGAGIVYAFVLALGQRYLFGAVRPVAAFSHPNSLAMAANLVFPVALAIVLATPRAKIAMFAAVAAPLAVVLTLSRGALVLTAIATLAVIGGSFLRLPTRRKGLVAGAVVALGALAMLKSYDTLMARFSGAPPQSAEARELFNLAAKAMLETHPFGVGINQYSHVLANFGYADELGITKVDRDGIAHHIYWLTAAETGYGGLLAYVLLIGAPLVDAARGLRQRGLRGDLALGFAVSIGLFCVHGTAEWVARQTAMSYLFWSVAGLAVASVRPSRNEASSRPSAGQGG